jgi:hypothetical protein
VDDRGSRDQHQGDQGGFGLTVAENHHANSEGNRGCKEHVVWFPSPCEFLFVLSVTRDLFHELSPW